jgi:hypothetical protein
MLSNSVPASRFVSLTDEWRQSLGLDHRAFAALIGRHEVDWSLVRRGKRRPSSGFASAVLSKAPEPWKSALEKAHLADLQRVAVTN